MPRPLSVLIVEDNPDDAELLVRELRRADFDPQWRRVDNEPDYVAALHEKFDVVLSDFNLPCFDGLHALALLKERGLEIPFILISGTIGEEVAVEAMKQGATDYLLKDRLVKLGSALTRTLSDFQLRRDRKQAESALHASEERFRELAETVHEVFWITEPAKNQMLYLSPAYEKIWGRTCDSLYAAPQMWFDAIHPEDHARVLAAVKAKQTAGTYDEEYRILRPDGAERWIRDRAFPVRGPDGTLLRLIGVAEDITESKKLQEQFLRAQRMEAIGTLAGGIAHDLNNILGPVLLAPALLKESLKSEHELQLLDLIEQSAQRGTNIVRQLLTFSRGTSGDRVTVQLRHLFGEMNDLMRATFPRDIAVEVRTTEKLQPVVGDPTQLLQVLMNLCVNARDAMPDGGKLLLEAKNVELHEADVQAHTQAKSGPHVAISVTDTGHGIPAEIVNRIFDPFFTTKPPTKGTGLGLSTVLGIVHSHHGFITVANATGRGTTFTIHLPVATDEVAPIVNPTVDALPRGQNELILVVDDEAPIRTALRMMLELHGYRVLMANNGAEGLALFLQNRDAIQIVLTDLMMPVMGGLPFIRALRIAAPELRVLVTSGLSDRAKREELEAAGVNCVLPKPCSARELLDAVHTQLIEDKKTADGRKSLEHDAHHADTPSALASFIR